jgi:hypothetical protein
MVKQGLIAPSGGAALRLAGKRLGGAKTREKSKPYIY